MTRRSFLMSLPFVGWLARRVVSGPEHPVYMIEWPDDDVIIKSNDEADAAIVANLHAICNHIYRKRMFGIRRALGGRDV